MGIIESCLTRNLQCKECSEWIYSMSDNQLYLIQNISWLCSASLIPWREFEQQNSGWDSTYSRILTRADACRYRAEFLFMTFCSQNQPTSAKRHGNHSYCLSMMSSVLSPRPQEELTWVIKNEMDMAATLLYNGLISQTNSHELNHNAKSWLVCTSCCWVVFVFTVHKTSNNIYIQTL